MKFYRFFLDEGDGGGSGSSEQGESFDPTSTGGAERTAAKYETQLSKEYQADDFAGIEDLNKLYSSYKSLRKSSAGMTAMPTAESSQEEVKAFYSKLGYPEKSEDYQLKDYDRRPDDIADMKKAFLQEAHRNYLSKGQAEALWKNQLASIGAEEQKRAAEAESRKASYPERLDSYLRESYPDDTRRKERITVESNLYQDFVAASGVGSKLAEAGLTSDPEFMHALASWYEKISSRQVLGDRRPAQRNVGLEAFYTTM